MYQSGVSQAYNILCPKNNEYLVFGKLVCAKRDVLNLNFSCTSERFMNGTLSDCGRNYSSRKDNRLIRDG